MNYFDAAPPSFSNPDGLNPRLITVSEEFLSGEIVRFFSAREHSKYLMNLNRAEMLDSDQILQELFFRQKRKLCRLGRGGSWHEWLRQNRISRSVADRLALEFAERHGLTDELAHRPVENQNEGRICQQAHRIADRLTKSLPSPRSRMAFLQVLADLLSLQADWENEAVRLSIPPPEDPEKWKHVVVPSVMVIEEDGRIVPIDYELKSSDAEELVVEERKCEC